MKDLLKIILFCYLFQLYTFEICKFVEHNFYLIALKKSSNENIGLNKYNYSLILESNPFDENDNYNLVFSVSFPININIELSPEIVYKFFSLKKFCLKDLIEKKQENIVGKIIEYNSDIQILERVWMKILDVNLYQGTKDHDRKKIYYLLGDNLIKNTKKYLFLKRLNQNYLKFSYQIVRVSITNENEQIKNMKIGTEFTVQDPTNVDFILREGFQYETFASDGSDIQTYTFDKIENLICINYQGDKYLGKCFDNNNTGKKVTYL